MHFFLQMMFLGVVGAAIGWITNYIAVVMLFRPIKPVKIFGIYIQGLIPRRRDEIAASIGKVVEDELVSMDDILDKLLNEDNRNYIIKKILEDVDSTVEKNIPSFIPKSLKSMIVNYVVGIVSKEAEKFLDESAATMLNDMSDKIGIAEIVEEKIKLFELEKLEKIILDVSNKELKMIVILGGVLGFVIGILQAFVVRLL
ncbi:MAG TPA: DUF445 family protein [Thermoanaerobacterium sp.]|nr:DUF445 family protein [Thermoanaerobacterium sp.]